MEKHDIILILAAGAVIIICRRNRASVENAEYHERITSCLQSIITQEKMIAGWAHDGVHG